MATLADYLDTDKIVERATSITNKALKRWVRGKLLTEEPLLSNLIYEFEDDDPHCVSARIGQVETKSALRLLHRQGDGNTDFLGSDLAVTLVAKGDRGIAMKTALLQVKKVYESSDRVKIEREQIDQVLTSKVTCGKSFVLCADPRDESIRIQDCQSLAKRFRKNAESHQPIPSAENGWFTVSRWTELWLKCKQGEVSEPFDPTGVEAALALRFQDAEGISAITRTLDLNPDRGRLVEVSESLSNTGGWLFTSIDVRRGGRNG